MCSKVAGLPKRLVADIAREGSRAGVSPSMPPKVPGLGEALPTATTAERFISHIMRRSRMPHQLRAVFTALAADSTDEVVLDVVATFFIVAFHGEIKG